jgi:hypothetical protein
MQSLYKLIFAIMVLKARRDELRRRSRESESKHDFSRNIEPAHDAALAHTC